MPYININNFHKGLSSSPYTTDGAFSKSQNLDVFSQLGIARISYLPVGYSTNLEGLPISFAHNSDQKYFLYFADDQENVYRINTNSGAISKIGDGKGNNIEFFNNRIYAVKRDTISYYDFDAESWSNLGETFSSLSTKDNHFMFVSRNDGKLYICGSYSSGFGIASLTTGGSWTQMAFTLPKEYKPISMTEMGEYLIISAKKIKTTAERGVPETVYFFWDRSSSTADRIISVPEKDMTTFIKRGDTIYVTGGEEGNVYRLTESGFQFYAQIPFDYGNKKIKIGKISDTDGNNSFESGTWWRGRILIGVSSEDGLAPAGIYGLKDRQLVHEFNPSHGEDGLSSDVYIGGMTVAINGNLYYGWKKVGTSTTYGIDEVSPENNRVPDYNAYLETQLYRVGTQRALAHFGDIDIQLARPLRSGEGVRLKYRLSIGDSWTTIKTRDGKDFTYSNYGGLTSFQMPFNIKNVQNIQFRVELTTGSSSTNTPYLYDITIPYYYG